MFVAKVHDNGPTGAWFWAIQAQLNSGDSTGYGITQGCDGCLYITGKFINSAIFFNPLTTNIVLTAPGTNIFVAKITDQGNQGEFLWAVKAGPSAENVGRTSITYYKGCTGGIYLTGFIDNGTIFFGPHFIENVGLNMFVAKLSETGQWQWVIISNVGPASVAVGFSITSDCLANIYVTGNFFGTVTFGDTILTSAGQVPFVIKVPDDRNIEAVGVALQAGLSGQTINVSYCPGSITNVYTDLVVGANYYIGEDGRPSNNCRCPKCPRFIGVACTSDELIFNPVLLSKKIIY